MVMILQLSTSTWFCVSCPSCADKINPSPLFHNILSIFSYICCVFPLSLGCNLVFAKPDEICPNLSLKLVMLSNSCLEMSTNILISHLAHNGFSLIRATYACAILERTSCLRPSPETTVPRYLKMVVFPNFNFPLSLIGLVIITLFSSLFLAYVLSELSTRVSSSCSSSVKNIKLVVKLEFG